MKQLDLLFVFSVCFGSCTIATGWLIHQDDSSLKDRGRFALRNPFLRGRAPTMFPQRTAKIRFLSSLNSRQNTMLPLYKRNIRAQFTRKRISVCPFATEKGRFPLGGCLYYYVRNPTTESSTLVENATQSPLVAAPQIYPIGLLSDRAKPKSSPWWPSLFLLGGSVGK
ncbi:hypothetical protein LOTGIDRAFT_152585 [Lottia gigantea]|uniref:Uncharacterized protein n=1 Tax=Lottia gigantea TaxID=225164 RepID=V4C741_LOTGI|nr:hypothetical protein LOTGIDRAFT_152585 [Lottia gigantea]ESO97494.1 hypothetical protein LOTGIDRAFT_152585 [Lottia gigantea]